MIWNAVPSLARKSVPLLIGAAVIVVSTGAVFAITSNNFRYSSPRTGYLAVHPMALSPKDTISASDYEIELNNSAKLTSNLGCFTTGIHLPHGAIIASVRVFYSSDDQSDICAGLNRTVLANGDSVALFGDSVVDNSGDRRSKLFPTPPELSVVNNNKFIYGFAVCISTGSVFYGARITYKYSNAGD